MNRKTLAIFLSTGLIGMYLSTGVYAQQRDPDADVNVWAAKPVIVDGNSAEWNEPLNNYNTDTKLAFALSNDEKELYIIIESLDEFTTRKVLAGGLTLNINTSGKKKDGIKINFLGMNQPPNPGMHRDSISHEGQYSTAVNEVQVSGFKNIPDGVLTLPDNNGIQLAAAFNKQRDYICELAIPLSLLPLKDNEIKPIAYNIKINGGKMSNEKREGQPEQHKEGMGQRGKGMHGGGGGGGRGGMGMSRGGGHAQGGSPGSTGKPADFWIKYDLASHTDSYRLN
jgi:hypothetical protein